MESKVDLWLAQLGLSEYAQAFAENHVDYELLPRLTAEDLRDIGISSVGHRRKLLDAIAHLAVNAPPQMPVEPEKAAQPRQERAAERRRLSVMFCDLVGSTGLSQRLDPEELSEVIRIYQNTVAGEVARYEGHVAKFMGDGVMALFGYPQAHEDDCERAIRSALSLVDAIGSVKPIGEHTLQLRIGISTGDVVVGDLVGEGAAQEEAVVGDTPNLAARLQELATPGHVAIDAATERAAKRIFALRRLGKHVLKGFDAEVEAWQVSGEHQTPTRFETNHQRGITEFVGRQHELGLLLERWQLAREGEGQVILLSGEAGIGKSRLVRAMTDAAKHDELIRLTYQCSPYHINSSLYPVLRHLERAAEFTSNDDDDARCAKLERLFPADAVPFIANLYSLISVDDERIRSLRADERKETVLGILFNQLMRLTDEKPVLFLFEDAHWIDPSTLDLLNQTVRNIFDKRLLMVLTHRPEWKAPFSTAPHVTRLALNPLSRSQVEDLVRAVAGPVTDEAVIQSIVARTDGVPLFVE
jgi:class 3 adenylate cyclase